MGRHSKEFVAADGTTVVIDDAPWKKYWKMFLAFAALLGTNVAVELMKSDAPWPPDLGSWVRWGLSIGVGTFLVWGKANIPNWDQIEALLASNGLKAVPADTSPPPTGTLP